MRPELREKIYAYNRRLAAEASKAQDMEIVAAELLKLPPGQLKKILTPEVIEILDKYLIGTEG